jgi:hypothetical protein
VRQRNDPVHSLSVESKAWRALHDLPPVLRALGDEELAARVARAEADVKPKVLDALRAREGDGRTAGPQRAPADLAACPRARGVSFSPWR